jgi:ribosomal protein S18 acetylase RimI-like enzyme
MPPPIAMTRERDKANLEAFLTADPAVNVYAIGDLDPSCWDDCAWHGLRADDARGIAGEGPLKALALTYSGLSVPCLQVLVEPMKLELLASAAQLLRLLAAAPERLPAGSWEAHLNSGLEEILRSAGYVVAATPHLRMALDGNNLAKLQAAQRAVAVTEPQLLTLADADACMALCGTLERSWFEPQCLDRGVYIGVYDAERQTLLAMAGTHVAAVAYGVAALGNIATRAEARRQGHGRAATRALCLALAERGMHTIGLNVTADNEGAIAMYASLGFKPVMEFVECDVYREKL